jgi:hypothetical protein
MMVGADKDALNKLSEWCSDRRAPRTFSPPFSFHDPSGDDDSNKATRCSLKKIDDPLGPDTMYNISATSLH